MYSLNPASVPEARPKQQIVSSVFTSFPSYPNFSARASSVISYFWPCAHWINSSILVDGHQEASHHCCLPSARRSSLIISHVYNLPMALCDPYPLAFSHRAAVDALGKLGPKRLLHLLGLKHPAHRGLDVGEPLHHRFDAGNHCGRRKRVDALCTKRCARMPNWNRAGFSQKLLVTKWLHKCR